MTYYRPLKEITAEYLKAYFDTPYFQAEMMKIAGMGTTRAHISILAQLKLKILLPPQDMQRRFVDFVAQADKSKFVNLNRILRKERGIIYDNYDKKD